MYPFSRDRGNELKAHLVRACIAAIDSIRYVIPEARSVQVDPIIHVATSDEMDDCTEQSGRSSRAIANGCLGYACWPDASPTRRRPGISGYLGANYYVHNQWVYGDRFIRASDPRYRPLHQLLSDLYHRYSRPIFLAETGIEDERRPAWLRYVSDEVASAIGNGVPVGGICLYPILNYPGWDDERRCHTGLWDYCDSTGHRELYRPMAEELFRQQLRIEYLRTATGAPVPRVCLCHLAFGSTGTIPPTRFQ